MREFFFFLESVRESAPSSLSRRHLFFFFSEDARALRLFVTLRLFFRPSKHTGRFYFVSCTVCRQVRTQKGSECGFARREKEMMHAGPQAEVPPSSTSRRLVQKKLDSSSRDAPLLLFSSRVHDRCRAQHPRAKQIDAVVHSERKLSDWSAIVQSCWGREKKKAKKK